MGPPGTRTGRLRLGAPSAVTAIRIIARRASAGHHQFIHQDGLRAITGTENLGTALTLGRALETVRTLASPGDEPLCTSSALSL